MVILRHEGISCGAVVSTHLKGRPGLTVGGAFCPRPEDRSGKDLVHDLVGVSDKVVNLDRVERG